MVITLTNSIAGVTLALPDQLEWPDEFAWQQVVQASEYTTTGALVLDAWVKQSGRPITLKGSEKRAWCARGALLTLRTWASVPGLQMTLAGLRGVSRVVVFDHSGEAISADPIGFERADIADTDKYAITLKFLEIA